jgi:hypothetical protein
LKGERPQIYLQKTTSISEEKNQVMDHRKGMGMMLMDASPGEDFCQQEISSFVMDDKLICQMAL